MKILFLLNAVIERKNIFLMGTKNAECILGGLWLVCQQSEFKSFDKSYKACTVVNYDSRVIPDLKIPHIATLEL